MNTIAASEVAATSVAVISPTATEVAEKESTVPISVADRLAPEIVRLCIAVADELLAAAEAASGRENTRQDRLLARLEVYRAMKQVIDERQLKLLNQGREIGVKNPAMATALGLRSGEAVRKKLPPAPRPVGGPASPVAE